MTIDRTEQASRACSTLMVGFHDLTAALRLSAVTGAFAVANPISDDELDRVERLLPEFQRLLDHAQRFTKAIRAHRDGGTHGPDPHPQARG